MKRIFAVFGLLVLSLLLSCCSDSSDSNPPSNAKSITAFAFEDPAADGTIDESAHTIEVIVPFGTDVTALVPTIVYTGDSITPPGGETQDFSGPVVYTVTAEDASTQDYTITVTVPAFVCGDPLYYQGETYPTVEIGTQCWLAKNLNAGTMVLLADGQGTSCSAIEKYCYADDESNCDTYGGLYTWTQAMCDGVQTEGEQGICPAGWHVPSDPEYVVLTNYLGSASCANYRTGNSNYCGAPAGDMLKAAGLCEGRANCGDSGFNGLMGGLSSSTAYGSPSRIFLQIGVETGFWTSSKNSNNYESWRSGLAVDQAGVNDTYFYSAWDNGKSVRCVKD